MRQRRVTQKCKNGRGCVNGKIRNGAYQETSEHSSYSEGSILGVGEGPKPAISYAEHLCPEIELELNGGRQEMIGMKGINRARS